MTLDDIVAHYEEGSRCICQDDTARFAALPSLPIAISEAALCGNGRGKRHSHQRRLKAAVLAEGRRRLLATERPLADAPDFETLHALVADALRPINGIGDLTIYDVATRIGAFLKLAPEAVYLHAGAAEGAKALGIRSAGGKPVPLNRFPEALRRLGAYHLENLLCTFKRELKRAAL